MKKQTQAIKPIDIVIPWVDSSDPKWIADHDRYTADRNSDNSPARYREWDVFRYWFRGIEKNAPWVRYIHLVTYGHLPAWLDTTHPKLRIVRHEDYIPEDFLPTFSSHTIEVNMHRIPDLAEQFIYFNDDVYLMKKTVPEDFFQDGLPRDTAVLGVIKNTDVSNFMPYIMLNMMGIINMNFSKRQVIKENFSKWFYPGYGKQMLNNLYLLPWGYFTGFRNFHTCVAYRKETFETVWGKYGPTLEQTCAHKFRSREDVNQYLFRYWQLASGKFAPRKANSAYLTVGQQSAQQIRRTLCEGKYQVVCVNDDPLEFDFQAEQRNLQEAFEQVFPEKSSFEK